MTRHRAQDLPPGDMLREKEPGLLGEMTAFRAGAGKARDNLPHRVVRGSKDRDIAKGH